MLRWVPALVKMRTEVSATRRSRVCGRRTRLRPGLAWRGGRSGDVLQGILDAGRCGVSRAIGEAAVLLASAGRRGDRGGEAGELEVDSRRGDFSPKFRRQTDALGHRRGARPRTKLSRKKISVGAPEERKKLGGRRGRWSTGPRRNRRSEVAASADLRRAILQRMYGDLESGQRGTSEEGRGYL
jgi:hypothetical protein